MNTKGTMWLTGASFLDESMRFREGNIHVDARGKIDEVSKSESSALSDDEILDCSETLILPGLVNAHFHSQSSLLRGLMRDMRLEDWGGSGAQGTLQKRGFRYLDEEATEEEFRIICLKDFRDLLRQGVTHCVDSGVGERPPRWIAHAMRQIGLRGVIDAYQHYEELRAPSRAAPESQRFAAHLPEEEHITDEALAEAERIKAQYDPPFLTHSLETEWRRKKVLREWGQSSIELFAERGLLGPKTLLFHGVHMADADIALVRDAGASMVHCPASNLSSGDIAPVARWLNEGINVALGTDWARTAIWEEMRLAYYLLKRGGGAEAYSAEDVLRMATVGGARAVQMEQRIGRVQVGSDADLLFVAKEHLDLLPIVERRGFSTLCHNLLMTGGPSMLRHLMIRGEWIIRDGQLRTIDEAELEDSYRKIVHRVFSLQT